MLLPADQRRLLGAFLRTHRERLAPAAVGLPGGGRRRTPGLRREEVAQRGGVSTVWYTWVEQGRDIALSGVALARLAAALRLTPAERAYLFELTRQRDPAPPPVEAQAALPAELAASVQAITAPAYVLDRLWHARVWNAAALRLLAPWLGSGEPCLLRYVFLDAGAPGFIADWENRARRLVAEFRADTAHAPEDAAMQALLRGLLDASPQFAAFWADQAVLGREGGARVFRSPDEGISRCEQVTFVPAAHPGYKLVMLLPWGGTAGEAG